MFTEQQIKEAHAKVKTGADYPAYIKELKKLGVLKYDYLVHNGANIFYGEGNFSVTNGVSGNHKELRVAAKSSADKLKHTITIHQQGQTDFITFRQQAADAGVEKWTSDLQRMAVIYYDKKGKELLAEPIPTGDY